MDELNKKTQKGESKVGKTRDLVLQMSKQLNDVHVFMMGLETDFANTKLKVRELEGVTERLSEENQALHTKVSFLENRSSGWKEEFEKESQVLQDIVNLHKKHMKEFVDKTVKDLQDKLQKLEDDRLKDDLFTPTQLKTSEKDTKPFVLPGTDVIVKKNPDPLNLIGTGIPAKKNPMPSSIILRNNEHGYAATFDTVRNVVTKVEKGHVPTEWVESKDDYERQVTPDYFKTPRPLGNLSKCTPDEFRAQHDIKLSVDSDEVKEAIHSFNTRLEEQEILIHNLQQELAKKAVAVDVAQQSRLLIKLDSRINYLENNTSERAKIYDALAGDVREHDKQIRTLNSSVHLLENRASVGDEVDKALSLSMDIVSAKLEKLEPKHGEVPNVSAPQLMNYETNGERAVITPIAPVTSQGVSLSEVVARLQVMERKLKDLGTNVTEVANQQHRDKEDLWKTVNNQHTTSMNISKTVDDLEIAVDQIHTNSKENNGSIKRLSDNLSHSIEETNLRLTGIYTRMDTIEGMIFDNSDTAYKNHKNVLQVATETASKLSDLDKSVTKTAYALDDKIRDLHKFAQVNDEKLAQYALDVANVMQEGFKTLGVQFIPQMSEETKQELDIWKKELDGVQFIAKKD